MDAVIQRLTATEVSVGDIRQTLTAQAQSADSVRNVIDQVSNQLAQVMAGHDRIHAEIAELRRGSGGTARGGGRRPTISPKELKLDVLGDPSGPGYRQQWMEWSDKAKDYLSL